MEPDIFKRKIETRGYMLPLLDEGHVVYKMITIGKTDYAIESTYINKKPLELRVHRYIPNGYTEKGHQIFNEELVVNISCRNQEELIEAIDKLKLLEDGMLEEPFKHILSNNINMYFIKKKTWIRK